MSNELNLEPCTVELAAAGLESPRSWPGLRSDCGCWFFVVRSTLLEMVDQCALPQDLRLSLAAAPSIQGDTAFDLVLIPRELEPRTMDLEAWLRRLRPGTRVRFRRGYSAGGAIVQENELGTVIHARPDELLVHVDQSHTPGDGHGRTEWNSLARWDATEMGAAPIDFAIALQETAGDVRRITVEAWNGLVDLEVRTVGPCEVRTTNVSVRGVRKMTGEPVSPLVWQPAIHARPDMLAEAVTRSLEATGIGACLPTAAELIELELAAGPLQLEQLAARVHLEEARLLGFLEAMGEAVETLDLDDGETTLVSWSEEHHGSTGPSPLAPAE